MKVTLYYPGSDLAETERAVEDIEVNIEDDSVLLEYRHGEVETFKGVRGVSVSKEIHE
jgi:hypothetical protein